MKILGLERDDKACNYYRVFSPLNKIHQLGLAECQLIEYGGDIASEESFRKVLESDVVLIPRPQSVEWLDFVNAVRRAGKVVVCDYDDDPFDVNPYNPYYRFSGIKEFEVVWPDGYREWLWKDGMKGPNGEVFFDIEANIHRRDMCRATFGKADLVTCTTPQLQEVFGKINPNTVVLPNFINLELYPSGKMMPNDKVRVGWQGGVSHFEDLEMLLPIITKTSEKHDIDFVYFGDYRLGKMFEKIRGYRHDMWVPIDVYPYKLKLMNFDIGLAPLCDNHFNRCKSAIKYFEYSAVGVPTIASNIPPYSDVITNMVDGVLCTTEEDWKEALTMLIENPDLRKKLADRAYENVRENYSIDKNVHRYVEAYQKALEKEKVVV